MLFKKLGIISFLYLILMGSSSSTPMVNDSEEFINLKTIVSQAGTILLKHVDTKDLVNLGASCKALRPLTDEIVSKAPYTIKTRVINNDMLVKWVQARIPFQNLRFISFYQDRPADSLMQNSATFDFLHRSSIPSKLKELSNTSLSALSLESVNEKDVKVLIDQMPSLKALTDLHLRVQHSPVGLVQQLMHVFLTSNAPWKPVIIDLSPISKLTTLKKLSFSNIEIENNIQIFSSLTALQDLALDFCRIPNIEFITKLVNLTSVVLKPYSIEPNSIDSFEDPPLSLDFLKPLLSLPDLTSLDVSGWFLSEEAARAFPQSITILHEGLK